MPQLFQVLKCFKCSVFQVHQTKKTSKWQCKVCGEKQSLKRHYALGTGKECRVHVQKLNGIRGEVNELSESIELKSNSDEDSEKYEHKLGTTVPGISKSKWSNYTKEVDVPTSEINESIYIGNSEVVLEVPVKKRKKFKPPKALLESTPLLPNYKTYEQNYESVSDILCTSNSNSYFNCNSFKDQNKTTKSTVSATDVMCLTKHINKFNIINDNQSKTTKNKDENHTQICVVPLEVNKNSKWAAFEDSDENGETIGTENVPKNIMTSQGNLENCLFDKQKTSTGVGGFCNLFDSYDESELDEVLEILNT